MGSRLAPKMAELCLDYVFDQIIPKLPFKLPFVFKFMDDTFTAIPENSDHIIITKFNSFNPRLRFTIESEVNHQIPFLDMLVVKKQDGMVETDWWSKPQNSGRLIHFNSVQPYKQKINAARNLLNRAKLLSSPKYHDKNTQKIKNLLKKNGYPDRIIKSIIAQKNSPSIQTTAPKPRPKFYSVPYVPGLSEKLSKILDSDNTKLAFKNKKTVGTLFSKTKDPIDLGKAKNVVYDIPCQPSCGKKYIGQTKNFLSKRVETHKNDCEKAVTPYSTALNVHSKETGHKFQFNSAKVLGTEPNLFKRDILEMLHIKRNIDTTVNFRTDVNNLNKCYSGLIKKGRHHPSIR